MHVIIKDLINNFWVIFIYLLFSIISCTNPNHSNQVIAPNNISSEKQFTLENSYSNQLFSLGHLFEFPVKINATDLLIDSLVLYVNGNLTGTYFDSLIFWSSDHGIMGENNLRIVLFYNDSLKSQRSLKVFLKSDVEPKKYNYRVINKYPHNTKAYTQGLLFYKGYLYESTGKQNESSVRKVEIKSGKVVKKIDMDPTLFGEGIALVKNQLFQITYTSQQGFVYDLNTFSLIRRFGYPVAEGWGLTYDGTHLLMSDGSAYIYFVDPDYFSQTKKIEVYNHKGKVNYLNELEFVNEKLYANIYGNTIIVEIDPQTGKVIGEIDCSDLVPDGFKGNTDKVLNGIAWNSHTNHFYITGKYWPVLYEIEIF